MKPRAIVRHLALLLPVLLSHLHPCLSSAPAQATPNVFTVRLGLAHDVTSPVGQGATGFAELVNDELGDRARAQLVTDIEDVLSSLKRGDIEMGIVPTTALVPSIPQMVLFDLPFFFSGLEAAEQIENSFVGQSLLASLETSGIIGLSYWNLGLNRLFSTKEITEPDDLVATPVWTTASTLSHSTPARLGLSPVSSASDRLLGTAPSPSAFLAMESGEFSAADLSPLVVARQPERFPFKQLLDIGYRPQVTILAVNAPFWDSLPYDLRRSFTGIAARIQWDVNIDAHHADKLAVATLANAGYEHLRLPSDLENAFRSAASEYWGLSFDDDTSTVLREAKYVRDRRAAVLPDHDHNWIEGSVFFVTTRAFDPSYPYIDEQFLPEYADNLQHGKFLVGLDRRTAIGADHRDSYHVIQFRLDEQPSFWNALQEVLDQDGRVILFAHGFKNSLFDAMLRAATLAFYLRFEGPVIALAGRLMQRFSGIKVTGSMHGGR